VQGIFAKVDYLLQEDRIALSVLVGTYDVGGLSEAVAKKYAADGLRIIKRSDPVPSTLSLRLGYTSAKGPQCSCQKPDRPQRQGHTCFDRAGHGGLRSR